MPPVIRFTLNGKKVEVTRGIRRRLLDVIRDDFDLTGTKEGCGEGVCGACSVILNGKLIQACLTPLSRVDGGQVVTIEGLGSPESPHPIQEAFVDAGAVQCGFCTPGIALAAKVLLDRVAHPSREDVVRELRGHLCRCTGYVKIVDAVLLAAERIREKGKEEARPSKQVIGAPLVRPEGLLKATGRAKYSADVKMEGMLYAKVLRSSYRHARILAIKTGQAEKLPGVVKVITARDIPGNNRFGIFMRDQPVLAEELVRWAGEPVALAVAGDERTAAKALSLIEVQYERLEEIADPQAALREGATKLHEEGNIMPLLEPAVFRKGDVEKGFAESDVIIERTYSTQRIEHAYLEPEAGVGFIDEEGRVTVRLGTQSVFDDQEEISHVLGLERERVRVIQSFTGGAFGGKYDSHLACLLSLATHLTGKPVKIQYNRRESFLATVKRHPYRIRYKTGATAEGRLKALEAEYLADTGAYRACGPVVARMSSLHATGPYYCPNVLIHGKMVFTNNAPSSAMRGFGAPQFHFAFESQMDLLADTLDMDPLQLRLLNGLDIGMDTVTGQVIAASAGFKKTLKAVEEHYETMKAWARSEVPSGIRRGVGLAAVWFGIGKLGRKDTSEAWLDLRRDGKIVLLSGAADAGQGQGVALRQLAAAELGLPYHCLDMVSADTALTPNAQSTVSSRILYTSGIAIREAAQQLQAQMLAHAGPLMEEKTGNLKLGDGYIESPSGRKLTFIELASVLAEEGVALRGTGKYLSTTGLDPKTAQGKAFPTFCFGAQVIAIELNTATGEVKAKKVVTAHDVGRGINPMTIEGQVHGAVVMGLGYALKEKFIPGVTRKMSDYRLPTIEDVPDIISVVVEEEEPTGPFGAKGVGEPPLYPVAPAIANAIEDACGVRVYELPADEGRVLQLLKGGGKDG